MEQRPIASYAVTKQGSFQGRGRLPQRPPNPCNLFQHQTKPYLLVPERNVKTRLTSLMETSPETEGRSFPATNHPTSRQASERALLGAGREALSAGFLQPRAGWAGRARSGAPEAPGSHRCGWELHLRSPVGARGSNVPAVPPPWPEFQHRPCTETCSRRPPQPW